MYGIVFLLFYNLTIRSNLSLFILKYHTGGCAYGEK